MCRIHNSVLAAVTALLFLAAPANAGEGAKSLGQSLPQGAGIASYPQLDRGVVEVRIPSNVGIDIRKLRYSSTRSSISDLSYQIVSHGDDAVVALEVWVDVFVGAERIRMPQVFDSWISAADSILRDGIVNFAPVSFSSKNKAIHRVVLTVAAVEFQSGKLVGENAPAFKKQIQAERQKVKNEYLAIRSAGGDAEAILNAIQQSGPLPTLPQRSAHARILHLLKVGGVEAVRADIAAVLERPE